MNVRVITIVSLLALLMTAGPMANAQYETEIAIQGPWILYQDNQFINQKGDVIPVLIAIAPADAIDYRDIGYSIGHKPDGKHHRPPQLTTGDGYYVTQPNIYCLGFASSKTAPLQCAPTVPNPSISNEKLIKIPHSGPHWDWWSVVAGAAGAKRQTALILPMPDSISNDGTWPVKFASQFDEEGQGYDYDSDSQDHSTGIILHYKDGPRQFGLVRCTDTPGKGRAYFGEDDCAQPATGYPHRTDTYLDNSGTLRIQMKSPYNVDGCDIHVRMGHRQMATLLKGFVGKHAFIEPGYYTDVNSGTIGFEDKKSHPCFTKERRNIGSHPPLETAHEALPMSHLNIVAAEKHEQVLPTVTQLEHLLADFTALSNDASAAGLHIDFFQPDPRYDIEDLVLSEQGVVEAKEILQSYNPEFPRLSQIARISTLLQTSHEAIVRFRKNNVLRFPQLLVDLHRIISQLKGQTGPGKGAGDCLAMPIEVVDGP